MMESETDLDLEQIIEQLKKVEQDLLDNLSKKTSITEISTVISVIENIHQGHQDSKEVSKHIKD